MWRRRWDYVMQSLSVDVYTGENSVGNLIQTCKQPATGTNLRFPVGEESYFQIGWLPSNGIIPKLDVFSSNVVNLCHCWIVFKPHSVLTTFVGSKREVLFQVRFGVGSVAFFVVVNSNRE